MEIPITFEEWRNAGPQKPRGIVIMFRADHSYEWSVNGKAHLTDTGTQALASMADLHKVQRMLTRAGASEGNEPMYWRDLGQTFPACPINGRV
jgi:hypothetical protein